MEGLQGHIRKKGQNLWIKYPYFESKGIPRSTIDTGVWRKQIINNKNPFDRKPEILYSSLTKSIKDRIDPEHELIALAKQSKANTKKEIIRIEVLNYVGENTYDYKKNYDDIASREKCVELAKKQAVYEILIDLSNTSYTLKQIFEAIRGWDYLPFKLTSYESFTKRLKAIKKTIKDNNSNWKVHNGMFGNQNRNKIDLKTNGNALICWYAQSPGINLEDVFQLYKRKHKSYNWPEIKSVKTIANFLNKPEIRHIWYAAKHGEIAARKKLEYKLSRQKASFPDALWLIDSTRIDLEITDQNGNWTQSLDICYVFDSHSSKIAGYSIGRGETTHLVLSATKNAIRNTGHLPYQISYDPGSANISHEAKSFFDKICKIHFPHEAKNPAALRAERYIKEFQYNYLKFLPSWTGGNITAKNRTSKLNPDILQALRKAGELPTVNEFEGIIQMVVKAYNESDWKVKTPRSDVYNTPHPKRRKVDQSDIIELFMAKRRKPVKYTTSGLTIEINKEKYTYTVKDADGTIDGVFYRNYLNENFEVWYDNKNPEWIALYYKGKKAAIATLKNLHPEAVADYQRGDKKKLQKTLKKERLY